MSNRFCPTCGHSNPYAAIKPTVCTQCKKPFEAAFATIVKPAVQAPVQYTPQPVPQSQQPIRSGSHRRFTGARGRNLPDPFAGAYQEQPETYGASEDGYLDKDSILEAAQSLASTISTSDFTCGADSEGEFHGRLQRPAHIPEVAQPVKTRRRKKA